MLLADDDEKKELYALRLENDTLRQNLGRLEEKVHSAEEQHATGRSTGVDGRAAEKDTPKELRQLHEILTWLHVSTDRRIRGDIITSEFAE